MQDYTKFKINEDIIRLASTISEEIPHYFLKDSIHKAKQVLKECERLLGEDSFNGILISNVGVVKQCLFILCGEAHKKGRISLV